MFEVIDVNRVLGPVPTDDVPGADASGLLAELDRLRIDAACVVHSHALHYDPATGNAALPRGGDRLIPVPVLVPGPLGTPSEAAGVVRLCPAAHRFRLTGPHGLALARDLAERGTGVLLGWDETTPDEVEHLATRVPGLNLVLINTGYRSLRELADLMDAHPRIHVDTATLNGHLAVEWVAQRFGAHRVLFGTGAPATDDAGPRFQLDHLDLPPADAALIAGGNARALLRPRKED
ncbi:amidohydrolase family protein [Actinomadura atramentaria]|uniref:amidohydrolase family protein n=1 Tax=Actinomadura atramentaria TaxID=1990 RepID=UPI000368BB36|nr:amidohydrolase family protein [Actinomadura atramentaria]